MLSLWPLYVIVGPTASGKTALGIQLAHRLGEQGRAAEIVNMDSMQLYRELPLLSAQPNADEQAQAPHRLYGICDVTEPSSTAWWAAAAKRELARLQAADAVPILVGGTGLYLQTLLEGIAPVPPVPAEIRAEAEDIIASLGSAGLHRHLDAEMQAKLQPGDRQRVQRAWEVLRATGQPLSYWQAVPRTGALEGYAPHLVVLTPEREALYARCDRRMAAMVAGGALAEVERLAARVEAEQLSPGLPLLKACGYPELAAHVAGQLTLDEALTAAQQSTRNYAKRQTTWFGNQILKRYPDVQAVTAFGEAAAVNI